MMSEHKVALTYGETLLRQSEIEVTTLSEALRRAVRQHREKGILYFQPNGTEIKQTYADLYEESSRILGNLYRQGLRPGDKVILQIEENQDYFPTIWACLLGGFVAIPLPVASSYEYATSATHLLQNVWDLCGHPLIIATTSLKDLLTKFATHHNLRPWQIASLSDLRTQRAVPDEAYYIAQPAETAFIIFTSGSTGLPKGVMLSHQGILDCARRFEQSLMLSDKDVTFHWLPLIHAMGLAVCHMRDVYLGCQQIHASPHTILQDPLIWLDCLDRYQVTCAMAPNFAFNLINEYAQALAERQWNLSSLRCLLIAGEIIVPRTVQRFLTMLAPHRLSPTSLYPHYGMTEALGISLSRQFSLAALTEETTFIHVGEPLPGVGIRIVDEQGQILQEGNNGHIQVTSTSVTAGYYRSPEQSREIMSEDGWLDTGDTGVLNEGLLTITGRTKDILIVNGRNYHCHEIEVIVENLPELEAGTAAACPIRSPQSNTDSLAIFYCPRLRTPEQIRKISEAIRAHVVSTIGLYPYLLIPLEKEDIPRTKLGKIQRSKLKQQLEAGVFDSILQQFAELGSLSTPLHATERRHQFASRIIWKTDSSESISGENAQAAEVITSGIARTETEQKLIELWQNVLHVAHIGIHDNFFALGGDSLLSIRMIAQAHNMGIQIQLSQLLRHPTIADLASTIETLPVPKVVTERSHELATGEIPFTSGQRWLLTEAYNPHYFNEGVLLEVHKSFKPLFLRQTVHHLIFMHDALRLRFERKGSTWRQFLVLPDEDLPVTWINLATTAKQEQKIQIESWVERLQQRINLTQGPIMQVAYFDLGTQCSGRLLFIINHAIVDYLSIDILLEDFYKIYQQLEQSQEVKLLSGTATFKEWTECLDAYIHSPQMAEELETYWLAAPWDKVASLPVDHPEYKEASTPESTRTLSLFLSDEDTATLSAQSIARGLPILDILLLHLVETIALWTGSPWVQVCILDHGRNPPFAEIDLTHTVGYIAYGRRILLEHRPGETPEQTLEIFQEQLASLPHRGMGYDFLYYLTDHQEELSIVPPPEVKLNYFSRINQVNQSNYSNSLFSPASENLGSGRDSQEPRNPPASIMLMGLLFTDQLELIWEYDMQLYDRTTIEHLAMSYLHSLQRFIHHFGK